ncbi:MAG: hypothetical protein RL173_2250, partial [Fibrobacterota bacterium]
SRSTKRYSRSVSEELQKKYGGAKRLGADD